MKRDLRYRALKCISPHHLVDFPSSAEKCTSTEESFAVVVHSPSHFQSVHINDLAAGEQICSPAASYFPGTHSLVPAAQRKLKALLLLRSRQLGQDSKAHLRSESAHTLQSRRDLSSLCRTNESPSRGKTLLAAFRFPPVQQVATWESPRIPQRLVIGKLRRKLRRKGSQQSALWASKASVAKK